MRGRDSSKFGVDEGAGMPGSDLITQRRPITATCRLVGKDRGRGRGKVRCSARIMACQRQTVCRYHVCTCTITHLFFAITLLHCTR